MKFVGSITLLLGVALAVNGQWDCCCNTEPVVINIDCNNGGVYMPSMPPSPPAYCPGPPAAGGAPPPAPPPPPPSQQPPQPPPQQTQMPPVVPPFQGQPSAAPPMKQTWAPAPTQFHTNSGNTGAAVSSQWQAVTAGFSSGSQAANNSWGSPSAAPSWQIATTGYPSWASGNSGAPASNNSWGSPSAAPAWQIATTGYPSWGSGNSGAPAWQYGTTGYPSWASGNSGAPSGGSASNSPSGAGNNWSSASQMPETTTETILETTNAVSGFNPSWCDLNASGVPINTPPGGWPASFRKSRYYNMSSTVAVPPIKFEWNDTTVKRPPLTWNGDLATLGFSVVPGTAQYNVVMCWALAAPPRG